MFIYFWDRERQSMNGGGAEREGDTEPKQAPGSGLMAQSLEPASDSVSPSLSAPHTLTLSLSLKNKQTLKKFLKINKLKK